MSFYTSEADATLKQEMVLKDVDLFISKFEYEGSGVESESSNDITLTPATSPSWSSNAYQSTTGLNLVVKADSSKVFIGKVKSNSATAVTFDATLMTNIADGTAGTASDWAVASSYDFYILTANSSYAHGDYFGFCREVKLNVTEDIVEYKKGVPRESIVEDTLEMMYQLSGSNANFGEDVLKSVLNLGQYGSQTSQFEVHGGFTPATRSYYRITLVGKNRNDKDMTVQLFKGQFRFSGDIDFGAEEYKALPFTYVVKKDAIRPDAYNALMWRQDE
jgi:hypothetical protein